MVGAIGAAGAYRVGRKLGRTIYRDDRLIGMMDTAHDGQLVVDALNFDRAAMSHAMKRSVMAVLGEVREMIIGAFPPSQELSMALAILDEARLWANEAPAVIASELERDE